MPFFLKEMTSKLEGRKGFPTEQTPRRYVSTEGDLVLGRITDRFAGAYHVDISDRFEAVLD
jgi:exosome complex RNA-binding protein Rrp4